MVQLWQASAAAKDNEGIQYWQFLDDKEKQYADSLTNPNLRNRYIIIHGKLRMLLGDLLTVAPQQLQITRTEFGKPFLVDFPDFVFNLSHTADTMLVATANNCLLGVDIEVCKARKTLRDLVDKCFSVEEQAYWYHLPIDQQQQTFYQFWTRKEAIVKATGRGIALGLKECVIDPYNPSHLLRLPEIYGPPVNWMLADFELAPNITGALAIRFNINYSLLPSPNGEGWDGGIHITTF